MIFLSSQQQTKLVIRVAKKKRFWRTCWSLFPGLDAIFSPNFSGRNLSPLIDRVVRGYRPPHLMHKPTKSAFVKKIVGTLFCITAQAYLRAPSVSWRGTGTKHLNNNQLWLRGMGKRPNMNYFHISYFQGLIQLLFILLIRLDLSIRPSKGSCPHSHLTSGWYWSSVWRKNVLTLVVSSDKHFFFNRGI